MTTARMPSSVSELSVTDLDETKTFPTPARREAAPALARKLVSQCDLFVSGVAKNVRTEFAIEALIITSDLLSADDGILE